MFVRRASVAHTAYHRKRHTFYYFPYSWTDNKTDELHNAGYYDENQNYYKVLAEYDTVKKEYYTADEYICEYCDSHIKLRWTEGVQPKCPNCGANLTQIAYDEPDENPEYAWDDAQEAVPRRRNSGSSILKMFVTFILFSTIIPVLMRTILLVGELGYMVDTDKSSYSTSYQTPEDIYVPALERSIAWNTEYGCYYDANTDCYFLWNDDYDIWQYWYEGISSDFEDSGWMEWDEDEQVWYIERSQSDWIVLPEYYDISDLWHF